MSHCSRTNYREGSVNCESLDKPGLVQGLESCNRAVDGDAVVVRLLERKEWSAPSEVVLEDEGYDQGDKLGEEEGEKKGKKEDIQPTGVVVGILKRKWRQYCGILQPNPNKGANKHIFVPAEKKIPKVGCSLTTMQSNCQHFLFLGSH